MTNKKRITFYLDEKNEKEMNEILKCNRITITELCNTSVNKAIMEIKQLGNNYSEYLRKG